MFKKRKRSDILASFFVTQDLYIILRQVWDRNEWDIKELQEIRYAMDNTFSDLDPNLFISKEFFYIDHLKT